MYDKRLDERNKSYQSIFTIIKKAIICQPYRKEESKLI